MAKEIKLYFGIKIIEYYEILYGFDIEKLKNLARILIKIFDKEQLFLHNRPKQNFDFIKESFTLEFQPAFNALLMECNLVNNNDSKDWIFANEDSLHCILFCIGIQVRSIFIGTELYTIGENKGRADIALKNKDIGIIIEVKYNGNANEALKQAITCKNLIKDQQDKIFIGLDISKSKEISIAGEIHLGIEKFQFSDYKNYNKVYII